MQREKDIFDTALPFEVRIAMHGGVVEQPSVLL